MTALELQERKNRVLDILQAFLYGRRKLYIYPSVMGL